MTRAEISARLEALAEEMAAVAVEMDYHGGLAEWARHGRELFGASEIARQWVEEMRKGDRGGTSAP